MDSSVRVKGQTKFPLSPLLEKKKKKEFKCNFCPAYFIYGDSYF